MTQQYYSYFLKKENLSQQNQDLTATRLFLHTEQRLKTQTIGMLFSLLAMSLWIGDWIIDSAHAWDALPFRLVGVLLLLLRVPNWLAEGQIVGDASITYACFAVFEITVIAIVGKPGYSAAAGLCGIAYALMGSVALGTPYPFRFNVLGCLLLAIIPFPVAAIMRYGNSYLVYCAFILPLCLMAILLHQAIRNAIVQGQYFRQQNQRLENTLVNDGASRNNAKHLEQVFAQLKTREGQPTSTHAILRVCLSTPSNACSLFERMVAEERHINMGKHIYSALRTSDVACPLHSLNYICILTGADLKVASVVAERIREKLCQASDSIECACVKSVPIEPHDIIIEIHSANSVEAFGSLLARFNRAVNLANTQTTLMPAQ